MLSTKVPLSILDYGTDETEFFITISTIRDAWAFVALACHQLESLFHVCKSVLEAACLCLFFFLLETEFLATWQKTIPVQQPMWRIFVKIMHWSCQILRNFLSQVCLVTHFEIFEKNLSGKNQDMRISTWHEARYDFSQMSRSSKTLQWSKFNFWSKCS